MRVIGRGSQRRVLGRGNRQRKYIYHTPGSTKRHDTTGVHFHPCNALHRANNLRARTAAKISADEAANAVYTAVHVSNKFKRMLRKHARDQRARAPKKPRKKRSAAAAAAAPRQLIADLLSTPSLSPASSLGLSPISAQRATPPEGRNAPPTVVRVGPTPRPRARRRLSAGLEAFAAAQRSPRPRRAHKSPDRFGYGFL